MKVFKIKNLLLGKLIDFFTKYIFVCISLHGYFEYE